MLPSITTEVHNNRLEIDNRGGFGVTQPSRYTLTVKRLTALAVSGSSGAQVSNARNLTALTKSGSGTVSVTGLSVTSTLRVIQSGSGAVTLSGQALAQDATLGGSGVYNARTLLSSAVSLHTSGSVSAVVQVSDTLEADARGSSSIVYFGSPRIVRMTTGGSATARQG